MILRALFLIVVLVEGVILIVPNFVGKQAETILRAQIESLSEYPGYLASVEQYQRGWWSSEVIWSIRIDPGIYPVDESGLMTEILGNDQQLLRMRMHVDHGPLLPTDGVSLGWASVEGYWDTSKSAILETVRSSIDVPALLSFSGQVDLQGEQRFEGGVPAFSQQLAGDSRSILDFGGIEFSLYSLSDGRAAIQAGAPWIRFNLQDQLQFSLSGMSFSGEGSVAKGWSWIGSSDLQMDEVRMSGKDAHMAMTGVSLQGESHLDVGDTLTAEGRYQVGQITLNEDQLSDFTMGLLFERISLVAIDEYIDFINQLGVSADDPLQLQMEVSSLVQRLLPEVLPRSPAISITELGFKWNDRQMNLVGEVRFNGQDFTPPAHFYDIRFWLDRLHIMASMQVEKPLAEDIAELILSDQLSKSMATEPGISDAQIRQMASMQAGSTLAALTQQRQLIQTQRGYEANFVLEQGEARLNGQLIPFLQ